jgi:hypothetical protein
MAYDLVYKESKLPSYDAINFNELSSDTSNELIFWSPTYSQF